MSTDINLPLGKMLKMEVSDYELLFPIPLPFNQLSDDHWLNKFDELKY
jgi:hypothetical protein